MKCVGDWRCFFLPYSLSITRFQLADFSFNFVQGRDVVQRFTPSAQWEHMVLVTKEGFEVLTLWSDPSEEYPAIF